MLDQRTGRFAEHLRYEVFTSGSGYDGGLDWVEDVSGAAHFLNADFAKRLAKSDAWLASRSWCNRAADGAKLTYLGQQRDVRTWRVTPVGGAPIELGFDGETGFLRTSSERQSESRLVTTYSDWRRLPHGPWIPFAEDRSWPEDESTTTVRITRGTLGKGVPAAAFAPPAMPKDHMIRGSKSTSVPYEDDARTRIYIPVSINGDPFTFELDSGGHLILTSETAAALHLQPVGELSSNNAAGIMKAGYVRLNEVRIGNGVLKNQPAKILPLSPSSSDRSPHPPRAGIIGLELFERFVVGIDRRSKTLSLSIPKRGARHAGVPLPISFVEDAPFVEASYAGASGPFMLDTGNAGRTIIEHHWAVQHGLLPRIKTGLTVDDGVYRCDSFEIGPFRLPHEIIGYYGPAKSGPESTRFAGGIFGEPLLSRFNATYDYSNGKIWLERIAETGAKPFDRSGLLLSKKPGQPFVIDAFVKGTPASRQLSSGEKIITINGRPTAEMSRADAAPFLSGPGKAVQLEVAKADGSIRQVNLRLQDVLPCSDTTSSVH